MPHSVFIFIALDCEAKPLIDHWRLKKHQHQHPFPIYSNEELVLTITGIGKVAMAGAVGYTMACFPAGPQPIILNIGIAGHREFHLGALYLSDKVIDQASGRRYYPQFPWPNAVPTGTVTTVAVPQTVYDEDGLYDMEAVGFYEMSVKFSTNELIHCLKIVSDNAQSTLTLINVENVKNWISTQLYSIDKVLENLVQCRQVMPEMNDDLYHQINATFHFSITNAMKLKALLQNWQLLNPDAPLDLVTIKVKTGKELINYLESRLATSDYYV